MDQVTAFLGDRIVARGGRESVTRELELRYPADHGAIHIFRMLDDEGRQVLPAAAFEMNRLDAVGLQPLDGRLQLGFAAAALGVDDEKGAAGHDLSHVGAWAYPQGAWNEASGAMR